MLQERSLLTWSACPGTALEHKLRFTSQTDFGPQVVAIKFQNRIKSMVWGDRGLSILTGLYITMCQFHNHLEVEFLPPHNPSPEEIADPGKRNRERP